MNDPPEEWMRPRTVEQLFDVSHTTLLRWDATGTLPAVRTPTGQRRWRQFDVEAVRAGRPLPTRDADGRVVAESAVRPRETAADALAPGRGE